MLSMVLTILKIIGISILILLGLFFLLVLIVLFAPIRYKADGFYQDTYKIHAKISWLLHIFTFTLLYEKEQPLSMNLRIFGILIYDNLNKKEKPAKKKKLIKDKDRNPEISAASKSEMQEQKKASISSDNKTLTKKQDVKQENKKQFQKKRFKAGLKQLFQNVKDFFLNIKYTFMKICDTIKDVRNNIKYYIHLFELESTKAALLTCKKQLLRIWQDIKPRKFQVNLHIGSEDPASMGDIMGIWGMLYPIHEGHIALCPDFEHSVFEGDFYCKGRITLFVYVKILLIIYFDKNIRRFMKRLMREGK